MRPSSCVGHVIAAAALCVAVASRVQAQTLAPAMPRQVQGLFDHDRQGDQALDVTVSALDAYDDNLFAADGVAASDTRTQRGGTFTGLNTTADYSKKLRRGELAASEGSTLRYYPTLSDIVSVQHAASLGLGLQLAHTKVNVTQTAGYSPFFAFQMTPRLFDPGLAELPAPDSDLASTRRAQLLTSTTIGLSQGIGRRTSVSFSAGLRNAQFLDEAYQLKTRSIGVHLAHNISKGLGVVAGYSEERREYVTDIHEVSLIQDLDIGLDYSRALGRTRRTTIGFTTGTTALQDYSRSELQYRLTATARLNREIGRTWHLTAAYHRGASFLEGLRRPFYADSLGTNVGGLLHRRAELSFVGGYTRGQEGFSSSNDNTEAYNGSAQLRIGVARRVAVRAEYHVYHYRFDQAMVLFENMPTHLDRRGVRVGLDLWLPLIH